MTKTELFLDKYKELENAAVSQYDMSADGRAVGNLERMPEFKGIRTQLAYCREVRNLLSHREKIKDSFAVEPSEAMIKLLEDTLQRIKNPLKLSDVAVMGKRVLRMRPEDRVVYAMKALKEKGFSHAPVMDGGRVTGVFSISTAFSAILSGRTITPQLTIGDISDIVDIDAHETEDFVFMRSTDRLSAAEELCESFRTKRRRIGLILLTSDGTRGGSLTGILTPWDVVGAE